MRLARAISGVIAATALHCSAGLATAQPATLLTDLARCRALADDSSRLRCFDQMAAGSAAKPIPPASRQDADCGISAPDLLALTQELRSRHQAMDEGFFQAMNAAVGYGDDDPLRCDNGTILGP